MNTGLISQNYDVINNITKKYGENKISSGTMRKMSDEEVREARHKQQNQTKTLSVDRSEVIDNVFSKMGDSNGVVLFDNTQCIYHSGNGSRTGSI